MKPDLKLSFSVIGGKIPEISVPRNRKAGAQNLSGLRHFLFDNEMHLSVLSHTYDNTEER